MKVTIENSKGEETLTIQSDGEGRYLIRGTNLPRRDGEKEYTTTDGLHVLGLLQLYFGANDSREYLTRRLKERECQTT